MRFAPFVDVVTLNDAWDTYGTISPEDDLKLGMVGLWSFAEHVLAGS